jgi:hypothetical protein
MEARFDQSSFPGDAKQIEPGNPEIPGLVLWTIPE